MKGKDGNEIPEYMIGFFDEAVMISQYIPSEGNYKSIIVQLGFWDKAVEYVNKYRPKQNKALPGNVPMKTPKWDDIDIRTLRFDKDV